MAEATTSIQKQKQFPPISSAMVGASEHHTSNSRILAKLDEDRNEVTIRVDRLKGRTGRPLYETLVLSGDEADALLRALMDEIG